MAERAVVVEAGDNISFVNGILGGQMRDGPGTKAFVEGIDVASINAATTMLAPVAFALVDGAIIS